MNVRALVPKSDEVVVSVEDITPAIAEFYMKSMGRNRPVSTDTVQKYARDMAAGNWRLSHQGIAFDSDGKLIDGQHRLLAVIASRVTVRMLVSLGLDPSVQTVVDGGRIRTARTNLHIKGYEHSEYVTGIANRVRSTFMGSRTPFTLPELERFYVEESKILEVIAPLYAKIAAVVGGRTSVGLATVFLCLKEGSPRAGALVEGVLTGANLEPGSPIIEIRNILAEGSSGRGFPRTDRNMMRVLRYAHGYIRVERVVVARPSLTAVKFFHRLFDPKGLVGSLKLREDVRA